MRKISYNNIRPSDSVDHITVDVDVDVDVEVVVDVEVKQTEQLILDDLRDIWVSWTAMNEARK